MIENTARIAASSEEFRDDARKRLLPEVLTRFKQILPLRSAQAASFTEGRPESAIASSASS